MTTTRALLVIDVQNDFCEGGSLAVTGGTAVATDITRHLRAHKATYAVVAATRDFHEPEGSNGGHFAAEPDFAQTWPSHCVQGTSGADYHPALDQSLLDVHVVKGLGEPAYSGFQAAGLAEALQGVTAVDVVGIATDYCVRATVLDALAAGFEVTVLTDLCRAVSPDTERAALAEMAAAGATLRSSERVPS